MALQSRGIWGKFPNRVFKAQFPFVCTLMWYVKKLVHYLLLLRSRFNMHQLLCMKFLLRETGLMIIFICAPPGIFNIISAKQKRQIMRAQMEMCYETRQSGFDNCLFSSWVWCRCVFEELFIAPDLWPSRIQPSSSAGHFSDTESLFQLLGPYGWISYCLLLK